MIAWFDIPERQTIDICRRILGQEDAEERMQEEEESRQLNDKGNRGGRKGDLGESNKG